MEGENKCTICGSYLIRIDNTLWQCSNRSICGEVFRDMDIKKKITNLIRFKKKRHYDKENS